MTNVGEVFAAPEEGALVFVGDDERRLRSALSEALPDVGIRRSAGGFRVDAFDALPLLGASVQRRFVWHEPAMRMLLNRRRAVLSHQRARDEVERLKQEGRPRAEQLLAAAQVDLSALDDHQWVNVAALTLDDTPGLCLFDEQGAGKTVTVIHAVDVLADRREVRTTLVVAPKSMLGEWKRDIERFMGDMYDVALLVGSKPDRRAVLASSPDFVVANFETVVSMEDELRYFVRRFDGRALLVVDESFNIKNEAARRTRALRRLREEFDRAVVLCGTPAPNAPGDVIAQFDLVDFGLTFRHGDVPDDRDEAVVVVRDAMEQRGVFVRHLKEDVLPDLPQKSFHKVPVDLESEQRRAYDAARDDLVTDLRGIDDREFGARLTHYLAKRAALLRLCSDPAGVIPGYNETPAKLSALDTLITDWVGVANEKVVIWSFYTATLKAIAERFVHFGAVRYDGSISSVSERRDIVRRFQEDEETMVFVGNAAAAGAGLTLHRARIAVYESFSNQAAHFLQSVDRIHRRGQDREVDYFVLLARETLDDLEFDRLLDKERRARDVLGDAGTAPVTRISLLEELTTQLGHEVS